MSSNKWFRRTAGIALACASVVSIAPLGGSVAPVVSAQATSDPGGEFHALTPTRILDTRAASSINDVQPIGAKKLVPTPTTDKSAEFEFSPLGKGGVPDDAADVLAVVANVTVTEPGGSGYVALYPSDFDFGGATGNEQISSLINFTAGASVPNLAIVGLDADGNMTFNGQSRSASSYHVIVDILGFISTSQYDGSSQGARLEILTPGRLLDTRDSSAIGPGQSRKLQIRGADTVTDAQGTPVRTDIVPDRTSVTAALVNLTLVNNFAGSVGTHATATPNVIKANAGATTPSSSNVPAGGIKANMTVVPVAADGSISLYNNAGNLHLVVDVLGYFEQGVHTNGNRGRIVPLEAPFRAFDTREAAFGDAPLQHGSKEEWSFDNFVESVVLNPDATNEAQGPAQQGLIGSLVAIDLQPLYTSHAGLPYSSYLKLTPGGASPAQTSNVNFFLGDVVPNMSLVKYGNSDGDNHVVEAYNNYGKIDYLLDVYAIVLDNEG